MICFWVGRAVSANRRLRAGTDHWHASKEYQAFKEALAWTLRSRLERFAGPVNVRLWAVLGPQMDTDAIIKPALDALQLAGVLENDKQVRHICVHREDRKKGESEDRIGFYVTEAK
jgi:Holliday junction resolvase RusA-like endonuclease